MKETLIRCHKLMVAMAKEIEKVRAAKTDERARTMAMLKSNLMSYMMAIWPNQGLFLEDIAILERTLQDIELGEKILAKKRH